MEFRIQTFETLWRSRLQPPQRLSRTEEYDDYDTMLIPAASALVRTNADSYKLMYNEEISDEVYWATVFDPA
jgi:hypothetical protein